MRAHLLLPASRPPAPAPGTPTPAPGAAAAAAAAAAMARMTAGFAGPSSAGAFSAGPLQPQGPYAAAQWMAQGRAPQTLMTPFHAPPTVNQHGPCMAGSAAPLPPQRQPSFAPWFPAPGDELKQKPAEDEYEHVADICTICVTELKLLYRFSCRHYPFCRNCMKNIALATPGELYCPVCKKQVVEARKVYRLKKIEKKE